MSMFNTINLVGGLLSLPINEGDIVEVYTNKGIFYGKIKRLGNSSMTVKFLESMFTIKSEKVSYKSDVTFDIDDINSILQY